MSRMGIVIVLLAILYLVRDRLPLPLFHLPGDIEIQKGRLHLLFPIMTCILVGLVASIVFSIFWRR